MVHFTHRAIAIVFALFLGAAAADDPLSALEAWRADQPQAVVRAAEAAMRDALADPARRTAMARRLESILAGPASTDAKDVALRQLVLVGDGRTVAAVAPLVADARLGTLAVDVLRAVSSAVGASGESVDLAVLLPALQALLGRGTSADGRAVEIMALLSRSDAEAVVEALAAAAREGGPDVRCAAMAALASSPSPSAVDALRAVSESGAAAAAWTLRACAIDALLNSATVAFDRGDRNAIDRLLERAATLASLDHEQLAVAATAMACAQAGDAAPVRTLLADERPSWFATALELVRSSRNPALTSAVIATLLALEPPGQAAVLRALGERGDPAAREAIERAALQGNGDVRAAACEALGRVGNAASVPVLATCCSPPDAGDSGAKSLVAAAERALAALRGDGVDDAIVAALARVPAASAEDTTDPAPLIAVPLLRALGQRGAAACVPAALSLARSANAAVRREALTTLGRVAGPRDLPALANLVVEPVDPRVRVAESRALVAAGRRVADRSERSAAIIAALDGNEPDGAAPDEAAAAALLLALGELGGDDALRCVVKSLEEPGLREHAVLALCKWPDASAVEPLAEVIRRETDPRRRAVAVAGLIKVASGDAGRPAVERVASLRTALELATEERQRRRVLEALGAIGDREVVPVLLPLLATPQREAAGAALIECAKRMPSSQRRFAIDALGKVAAHAPLDDGAARGAAAAAANVVEQGLDFVQSWQVAGPFQKEGCGLGELMGATFAPEQDPDGPQVFWREVLPVEGARGWRAGVVDLARVLGPGENRVAYLRTHLHSPRPQPVRLELGSDDGVKVWLDGRVIDERNAPRGLRAGEDAVEANLAAGWNTLLLKVTQGAGDWAACCRVRGRDGFAADGVHAMADPGRSEVLPGATVLLGGSDLSAWSHRDGASPKWNVAEGVATVVAGTGDIVSRQHFGDCTLHAEFLCPDTPPEVTGQARSNSGVYLQDRYEVQVLDAFGDEPAKDLVGAIYSVRPASVHVARRPGQWQDLLIDFRAPRWDTSDAASPRKVSNARMTVWLNGVRIHDDIEVPGTTTAGAREGPTDGPVRLQDHGNPVRFRNVWVVPRPGWEGPGAAGFEPLFDGRTLDGWTRRGGEAEYAVEDGAIVGRSKPNQPNTFLCTQREPDDFVLELEFKADAEMNSGVQFRSAARPEGAIERVFGYQSEIDPSNRAWTGGIYDEGRRGWLAPPTTKAGRDAFVPGEWNRLRIEARGAESRTWINGVPVALLWDRHAPRGFVGLQVHGVGDRQDPLEVRWRDLRVKPLDR